MGLLIPLDSKTYYKAKVIRIVCYQKSNSEKKNTGAKNSSETDIIHVEIYYIIKLAFQMWKKDELSNKYVGSFGQLLGGGK